MNQGPTTPTADPTKFNVTRIGDFAIRVGFDGAAISFVAGDTHDAQLAVLALGKALEAGRAQGRAEAPLEATKSQSEALAAAQNTIAALRADVEKLQREADAARASVQSTESHRKHLATTISLNESLIASLKKEHAEMQRRALDAEAVLGAVRDALDLHPNDSLLNAIDALKDENEDGGDALTKARDEAELAVLEAVKFAAVHQDAQSMSFAAQAFAALRGAE